MSNQLYDWFGLNESLFRYFNSVHGPVLDQLAVLITLLGHPRLFPFYLAIVLVVKWIRPTAMALRNIVVFAISYALSSALIVPILKAVVDLPRPLTALGAGAVAVLGSPDGMHSFPSGHAAFAVLMAASLVPGLPRWGQAALITYATLVCLSRVVVGAHFPADVVAGAAISIIVVSCARYATGLSKNRRK